MDAQGKIQKQIDKKNAEVEMLEEHKAKLQSEINACKGYIGGLEEALKVVTKEMTSPTISTKAVKSGSSIDKAQKALRAFGQPMHINALVDAMGGPNTKSNRINVGSSISQNVRINRIFTRPQANTFGLIEWDTEEDDERDPDAELHELQINKSIEDYENSAESETGMSH